MDSLTQIVLGAAVGEAVLGKKVGNKAILWGAIAGTVPDLDVFLRFFTDDMTARVLHRGFSHSILFSVLFAPILGWIASKVHAKLITVNWRDWSKLMFFSLVTHPLLDAHTNYGTQLFWPLDSRLAYNNIFIIDPLYTLPFLGFLVVTMFYKKENSKRWRINKIGLVVSTLYMLTTLGIKWYTHQQFTTSLKKQEISYKEVSNQPTPMNCILWSANVETEKGFRIGYYSIFDRREKINFTVEIPKNHFLLDDLKEEKKVRQLIKMSKGWYSIEEKRDHLIFNDLRFGVMGMAKSDNNNFVFSFKLVTNKEGRVEVLPNTSAKQMNVSGALKILLDRIKGN